MLFDQAEYSQYNIDMIITIDHHPIAGFFRTDHDPPTLFQGLNYQFIILRKGEN